MTSGGLHLLAAVVGGPRRTRTDGPVQRNTINTVQLNTINTVQLNRPERPAASLYRQPSISSASAFEPGQSCSNGRSRSGALAVPRWACMSSDSGSR